MSIVDPTPLISAIICTHNRADLVTKSIRSLFKQVLQVDQFEVIVVDNASVDNTGGVIAKLAEEAPPSLRYICVNESRLGISHARNAGVQQARGRYIAFLDDGGIAVPNWLQSFIDIFSRSENIGAVGGPIHPIWMKPRPCWLSEYLESYYSVLDLGLQARPYRPYLNEWLGGGNLALLRRFMMGDKAFSTRLGRSGSSLLSNEETFLLQGIIAQGFQVWYQPAAGIDHHVHADRLNRFWLLRRCFWQGVSNAVMTHSDRDCSMISQLRFTDGGVRPVWRMAKVLLKEVIRVDILGRPSRMNQISRLASDLGRSIGDQYLLRQSQYPSDSSSQVAHSVLTQIDLADVCHESQHNPRSTSAKVQLRSVVDYEKTP